jgi:hypothetical protein
MLKSLVLLSNIQEQCVTFYRPEDGNYYLGYRFWEGAPEIIDAPSDNYDRQPLSSTRSPQIGDKVPLQWDNSALAGREWLAMYDQPHSKVSERIKFRSFEDGSARVEIVEYGAHLSLELHFEPYEDGISLKMKVFTTRAVPGGCCLQQCLRFTGGMNAAWRTKIAHVPYLSEFDMHAMGRPNATLTYGHRGGTWSQLPVEYTVVPTISQNKNAKGINKTTYDHGLIVRESPHRDQAPQWYWDRVAPQTDWDQISAGMYWERTAMVSNRHPADCVHSWVDIGPLAEGETRIVQGKVYYLEGSKDDLLSNWQRDFSSPA